MIVLDTDYITLFLRNDGSAGQRLKARLEVAAMESVATTILTYEEQSRGWLAHLSGMKSAERMVAGYAKLSGHLNDFRQMDVLDSTAPPRASSSISNVPKSGSGRWI